MKLVSVIIPCFNAAPWISEAIDSVLKQGIDDIEIIVIDDGSTDNSADIVAGSFPVARLIRTANQGPSKARNLGTGFSSGRFLQYLDADDMLLPGKLQIQLAALESSGADIAYGDSQKLMEAPDGTFKKGEEIRRILDNPEIGLLTSDTWCPIHTYLFRREIVDSIGGWNERLPFIQDARFALDCALHGARFVYCPGLMVYYRIRKSNSVSTRDPKRHTKDCFNNAVEIEEWWHQHGGVDEKRKEALLKVYGYTARATFKSDRQTFELAHTRINNLSPGYIPDKPKHLKLVSRLIGYRRAEGFALWYREIKSRFKKSSNKNI